MTDQDTRYPEQLVELDAQPLTLLDPKTGRAVRVGAAAVFAFAAGVASNPRP